MMSAMTAHRSPDTDPKDSADQILVPKDDAEHTYARLVRTRATRPTRHEKLCDSHRSPPSSRRMSRSMPLYLGVALHSVRVWPCPWAKDLPTLTPVNRRPISDVR